MENMWQFKTKNFTVVWFVEPSIDVDISWDETGEVLAKLQSGEFTAFDSTIKVFYQGNEVGSDHLGESIYSDVMDFRREAIGNGAAYFRDMVSYAIEQARETLRRSPYIRSNA